ncbi:hypothetical protein [Candidatus Chloroploca sp. Khr17]|uniref:hypothetical protein n=1 Tax=Candidatus Chloroploca sp. Khr17 TaxID=2496869 RepID=UPI00101C8B5C|nr:hypothetical protein [Candidatus Chloroploca sp. Khr17]
MRLVADRDATYVIQIRGKVEPHWQAELQMQLTYAETESGTITTLTGYLPDQAAMLGVLNRLAMWGYQIVQVRYLPPNGPS